ncbi:hypothetical protein B9Z55_001716 [Caenorhabditis nigoni]|uniref:Uncharacterized protein n=2 Tax=Caenorhabditis TaxID=6237 RepID=A0AAE9DSS2_CAEBR|nr:hypothetical protein B9Z55_001716 [Caenorhabditis nigoni]ULU11460.1 hypothetical protein L3Y34_015120 [Caenorhabditis briggsae]
MNEKDFLFYYLLGIPVMIWSATFILAFIRIWHNNHRDLTEERKKWEEQQRVPTNLVRERRVVVRRRRRRKKSTSTTATPSGSKPSTVSREQTPEAKKRLIRKV